MSESKFKTMRHIETVRNYLNAVVNDLLKRSEEHDQTKLEKPEVDIFEEYTPKLRDCTYDSDEYRGYMKEMKIAIDHHNKHNRHHPEYYSNGFSDMTLFDLIELLCDWKSASMRHNDGNIYNSIEINQKRFNYSDDIKQLLIITMQYMDKYFNIKHKANES